VLIIIVISLLLTCFSSSQWQLRGESEASEKGAEGIEQVEQTRRAQQDGAAGQHSQLSR